MTSAMLTIAAQANAVAASRSAFSGKAVSVARVSSARAARSAIVAAAGRPTWYPGATPPKHLDGSIPGDYGFDPLRLGAGSKDQLAWYVEGELTNGRWAMAAVAGILFTDLIGKGTWWDAGARVDLPLPLPTLIAIEVAVFALLEYKRYEGYKKTGGAGVLSSFPFDPMGMKSAETQLKEVKNGRLAMVALVGFASQAAVRGKGPIECLTDHIADPFNVNIFTSKVGTEAAAAVIALCIIPIIIEAKNNLTKRGDDDFRPIPF